MNMNMNKITIFAIFCLLADSMSAQLRMRDVFAQLPDSVLPLMTKNNRLDCIDFIENDMEARVKNLFDDKVVLDSLTDDFLSLSTSEGSYVEMKLFAEGADSFICVNRTYLGQAADSEVKIYDLSWNFVRRVARPDVREFLKTSESIDSWTPEMADTLRVIRAEAEFLPLIKASLSSNTRQITWVLQKDEFSRNIKKVADKYLQPVVCDL